MDISETVSDDMLTRAHSMLQQLLHAAIAHQDTSVIDEVLKPWLDLGGLMELRGLDPESSCAPDERFLSSRGGEDRRAAADQRTPTGAGEALLEALAEFERLYGMWREARASGADVGEVSVRAAVEEVFEAASQIGYYQRLRGGS